MKAIRRSLLFIVLILSGLGWTFNRTILFAEQPAPKSVTRSDESSANQPVPAPPSATETQQEQAEINSDPLFQAILQHFKEGREKLSTTTTVVGAIQAEGSGGFEDHVTPAQWQAVELILRAARILESDEKRIAGAGGISKPTQGPSIVKQLRSQAERVILSAQKSHSNQEVFGTAH